MTTPNGNDWEDDRKALRARRERREALYERMKDGLASTAEIQECIALTEAAIERERDLARSWKGRPLPSRELNYSLELAQLREALLDVSPEARREETLSQLADEGAYVAHLREREASLPSLIEAQLARIAERGRGWLQHPKTLAEDAARLAELSRELAFVRERIAEMEAQMQRRVASLAGKAPRRR